MSDEIILLYKRLLFVGVQVIISLFLISFILSSIKADNSHVRAATPAGNSTDMSNSPNVITSGVAVMADKLTNITGSTVSMISDGVASIGSAAVGSGKVIVRSVDSGLSVAARATGNTITFVANAPGDVLEAVSNTDMVDAVIRPSDNMEVPIIDPDAPELRAALAALPPAPATQSAISQSSVGPIWPMNGRITAGFGVPHWPYQRTHSGIDISNGQPSGTTPAKPFRPGKVVEVVHSRQGLGNHVIVDHGNGINSVYAHLHSTSVSVGQEVNLDTTLGFVGSTGVSTGPHLHFEIRVNGKAANPRQFLGNHP